MKNIQKYIPLLLLVVQTYLLQAQNPVKTIGGFVVLLKAERQNTVNTEDFRIKFGT